MNLSSLQCFKQFNAGIDLSDYTTDEIALKAADENDNTGSTRSSGTYTAELILRCRNLFKYFNRKYSTMIEKDRMEEIEYDALFRSLRHFKVDQQSKFETYFTNQIRLGYIYEFRKMHVETTKERKERQRREKLVKEEIDISDLEPLKIVTNDDDMRNKMSIEDQDLVFKLTPSISQSNRLLEIELLSMFTDKARQLVEILISNDHIFNESQAHLIELINLRDEKLTRANGIPYTYRKEAQYRQIIQQIAKKLNLENGTNYSIGRRQKDERTANNNR